MSRRAKYELSPAGRAAKAVHDDARGGTSDTMWLTIYKLQICADTGFGNFSSL